jgi:hypothetical protein
MRQKSAVVVLTLTMVVIGGAAASATTEVRAKTGTYSVQAGDHTTDNAIAFTVRGSGHHKSVRSLVFRNECLTNNEANPPRLPIRSDGHFAKSWISTNTDSSHNSLAGRFVKPKVVKGTLSINDQGCKSVYHFRVHRGAPL